MSCQVADSSVGGEKVSPVGSNSGLRLACNPLSPRPRGPRPSSRRPRPPRLASFFFCVRVVVDCDAIGVIGVLLLSLSRASLTNFTSPDLTSSP